MNRTFWLDILGLSVVHVTCLFHSSYFSIGEIGKFEMIMKRPQAVYAFMEGVRISFEGDRNRTS